MSSNHYPFIAREAWPILIIIFSIVFLAKFFLSGPIFVFLLLILLITIFLFRDPYREIPSQPLAVVSPIHGIISKVGEAKEIRLNTDTIRIRVVMRITDIYSLRSPIEGKVIEQWYNPSCKNQSHQHLDFHVQSDEGDDIITAIRFRNIMHRSHIYLNSGERVGQGQRCGYLSFGGVVDLFLPVESKILVKVGQYVDSGSTVLAELIHSEPLSSVKE
ncbi:MAG: phosphatidylserine decarboxylase [Pseudomonadota bacterium]|jgi:phosphatidylserine decarboxylase|nr:phosphatidylserine decarboxylase [Pseudomonadota bacterium]|tara:strand:+ start:2646 stop:3296 length:651 start_codon:yes stop_codon:yes gene_type:complete